MQSNRLSYCNYETKTIAKSKKQYNLTSKRTPSTTPRERETCNCQNKLQNQSFEFKQNLIKWKSLNNLWKTLDYRYMYVLILFTSFGKYKVEALKMSE